MNLTTALAETLDRLDIEKVRKQYFDQDEAIIIQPFLTEQQLEQILSELPALRSEMHRSHVPGLKQSSSVSRFTLDEKVPIIRELYESKAMLEFLQKLTGRKLHYCPETDPHTCTLYCYLEKGDYFGGHYDTNFYRGTRFTVLLGLVNRTESKLVCELYKKDPKRKNQIVEVALQPGTLVVFNCLRLYHWVTPLRANEERIVLALEYVTDPRRATFQWLMSNMKDAVVYFGFKEVFGRSLKAKRHSSQ